MRNIIELIEIFLLIVPRHPLISLNRPCEAGQIASYMSAVLASMLGNALENCPMIDIQFQAFTKAIGGLWRRQTPLRSNP